MLYEVFHNMKEYYVLWSFLGSCCCFSLQHESILRLSLSISVWHLTPVCWILSVLVFRACPVIPVNFTALDACNEKNRKMWSYSFSWKCCEDKPVKSSEVLTHQSWRTHANLLHLQLSFDNMLMPFEGL